MSTKPVGTIIRSDAPHVVEVKPGSLNASSTKSWVEAGEVDPDNHIEVTELPPEGERRAAIAAQQVAQANRQAIEQGPAADHRTPVPGQNPVSDRRVGIDEQAIEDHREALPDHAQVANRVALPDQDGVNRTQALPGSSPSPHRSLATPSDAITDHHEAVEGSAITDHHEAIEGSAITDHHEAVPDRAMTDNRARFDAGGSVPHDLHLRPDELAHPGVAHPDDAQGAGAAHVASTSPLAHVHLTQDPEEFKSRVAAIRKSVSHISGQLDDLKK